ncbi:MAG: hypothetical protein H6713_42345 [Myxococcales bacterium]|nr:hypothetical protein [Myxococcales bacterium]MCB9756604.1 hypothetical protein [Myxococcales bacterium]
MPAPLVSALALLPVLLLTGADADAALPVATPPIPVADTDALARAPGTPTTLYVNFDGAVLRKGCGNDARRDCSSLADLFDGYVGPFTGSFAQRFSIIDATRRDVDDFGVRVVMDRPPDDVDYSMVLYGDLGAQTFAGIAPYIDCGDLRPGDTSFSQGYTSPLSGATIILQEAAHTWGLEHVDSPVDTLNPFKTSYNQAFTDQCHKIVANTDLDATSGACNQVHTLFCEAGYQNSWQEMLYLFGTPVPDTSSPTLTITSPEQGSVHALPVTLPLYGEITDDYHPQRYQIRIFQGDKLIYEEESHVLSLNLEDPPAGAYELRVEIADEGGNMAEDVVSFEILPEGSEVPGAGDTDTDGDGTESGGADEGGCGVDRPSAPRGALALLVLLAAARRRRGSLAAS